MIFDDCWKSIQLSSAENIVLIFKIKVEQGFTPISL
jgi:hypothetical protein